MDKSSLSVASISVLWIVFDIIEFSVCLYIGPDSLGKAKAQTAQLILLKLERMINDILKAISQKRVVERGVVRARTSNPITLKIFNQTF